MYILSNKVKTDTNDEIIICHERYATLDAKVICALQDIRNQASRNENNNPITSKGFIHSPHLIIDLAVFNSSCHVIMAKRKNEIIGYVLYMELGTGLLPDIPPSLSHERDFLQELHESKLKVFYIDQVVVRNRLTENQGIGVKLLHLLHKVATNCQIDIMAGIIHTENLYSLRFFRAFHYETLSYYRDSKNNAIIWAKTIRRMRPVLRYNIDHSASCGDFYMHLRIRESLSFINRNSSLTSRYKLTLGGCAINLKGFSLSHKYYHCFTGFECSECGDDNVITNVLNYYKERDADRSQSLTTFLQKDANLVILVYVPDGRIPKLELPFVESKIFYLTENETETGKAIAQATGTDPGKWVTWIKTYIGLAKHDLLVTKQKNDIVWLHIFNPLTGLFGLGMSFTSFLVSPLSELSTVFPDLVFNARIITSKISESVLLEIKNTVINETTKSAKAAIMSRNMSHNLGSHVMSYLKQKLNSVDDIINAVSKDLDLNRNLFDEYMKNTKDGELSFLVGIGRFLNYLQERQDYIATIATDYIPAVSPISFKDFIYDELKMEERWERHKVKGKKPENILLDFIAYSEKYESASQIKINFGEFDGSEQKAKNFCPDFEKLRQLEVAFPSGITGRQAFFSIMENLIRNTAKHSANSGSIGLTINTFRAEEKDAFFVFLKDSKDVTEREYAKTLLPFNNKYHFITITDESLCESKVISRLRDGLKEDFIGEDGKMLGENKGLKEIRISAAWMRNIKVEDEMPEGEPPIVFVRGEKQKNRPDDVRVHIQYIICLLKPKKVALVFSSKTYNDLGTIDKEQFPEGWNVFKVSKDNKGNFVFDNGDFSYDNDNNYDLLVAEESGIYDLLRPYVPPRICWLEPNLGVEIKPANEIVKILLDKNSSQAPEGADQRLSSIEQLEKDLYHLWCKQTLVRRGLLEKKKDTTESEDLPSVVVVDPAFFDPTENFAEVEKREASNKKYDIAIEMSTMAELRPRNKIIYTTHYDGQIEEREKAKKTKAARPELRQADQDEPVSEKEVTYQDTLLSSRFVESISGGNSTDRLIRRNDWTPTWYYKTIEAATANVAIFDERLFDFACPCSNSGFSLNLSEFSPETELNSLSGDIRTKKCEEMKNFPEQLKKELLTFFKTKGKTVSDAHNLIRQYKKHEIRRAQSFYEKRVFFFDIKKEGKDGDPLEIWGYTVEIAYDLHNSAKEDVPSSTDEKGSDVAKVRKIGTIKMEEKKILIEFEDGFKNKNKFDFLSLHQGLLDKIYDNFKEKEKMEVIRETLFAFSRAFMKKTSSPPEPVAAVPPPESLKKAIQSAKATIMSRNMFHNIGAHIMRHLKPELDFIQSSITIHSGRSVPSQKSNPSCQPFLQYSALENAVKDCKYTLMELLNSAYSPRTTQNNHY